MGTDYILKLSDGEELDITTYGDLTSGKPALIFVHGFKGFKDWGFGPYLADYFSREGFFVITFNFSHNGVGRGTTEFNELDKFAENTFSREADELNELIKAASTGFFDNIEVKEIGLLGHSRGGAIAIFSAAENELVKALVTWSSISELDRYSERQKREWKERGFFEAMNMRTKQRMRMNVTLLEDIEKNKYGRLNIQKAVESLNKPYLIVHGDQDLAVNVEEAKKLFEWSHNNDSVIHLIEGAGHTFDIKHPFDGSSPKFDEVISVTSDFFIKKILG